MKICKLDSKIEYPYQKLYDKINNLVEEYGQERSVFNTKKKEKFITIDFKYRFILGGIVTTTDYDDDREDIVTNIKHGESVEVYKNFIQSNPGHAYHFNCLDFDKLHDVYINLKKQLNLQQNEKF